MIYDEATNFAAADSRDAGTSCWISVAAVETSEAVVAFLESVFEDRDQDLIQLFHPFERLDSEPQKRS